MKILIIGNGGREHALAWKVAQSPLVSEIFVAPGNAGTADELKSKNIAIQATDIENLIAFAKQEKFDLTIVGPEAPLALGVVDQFHQAGLKCFGASQKCAQLETSKAYAKIFMQENQIPTAGFGIFESLEPAIEFIRAHPNYLVIKADGLAAGKGVVVADSAEEAIHTVEEMLAGQFGNASKKIIIEEKISGIEASFMVVADGKTALVLPTSQDHKRRDDGDKGPNTGGMGAYSPAKILTDVLQLKVMQQVIYPVLAAMQKNGTPYKGFLYAGLMIQPDGDFKVLEFNCRLGDPETQPIMMRLKSDLVNLLLHAESGNLDQSTIEIDPRPALGVVIAEQGYPNQVKTGQIIDAIPYDQNDCKLFHAGTEKQNGELLNTGGRVFCATAIATHLSDAKVKAYQLAEQIVWPEKYYRRDIGKQFQKTY